MQKRPWQTQMWFWFLMISLGAVVNCAVTLAQEAPAADAQEATDVEPATQSPAAADGSTSEQKPEKSAEEPTAEAPTAEKPTAKPANETEPMPATPAADDKEPEPAKPEAKESEAAVPDASQSQPAPSTGQLPWKKPTPRLPGAIKPIDTPLQFLELRGIAQSEWEKFRDGEPWGADDQDLLLKLLLQYPRIGLAEVAKWRQKELDWSSLTAEQGSAARGEIFQLQGTVREVHREELIPELVDLYEFEHYYRLQWIPAGATVPAEQNSPGDGELDAAAIPEPRPLVVFVREIPSAWKNDEPVSYPASIDAIFLRMGAAEPSEPIAFLVGNRVAWHPQQPVPEENITADHVLLAQHGFDVGLLPTLKESDAHPFEENDREPFYETLFALSQLKAADWHAVDPQPLKISDMLGDPSQHRLELVEIEGNVRRIVKVLSDQEDLQRRFGIDHYYEVDFFIPLGNQAIKLGKDPKAPLYENDFPATLCVLELPPGVKAGDDVRLHIAADAAFYRVWSYRSEYLKRFDSKARQVAPMFLANSFRVAPDGPELVTSRTDIIVGAVFLAALGLFGAFIYYASKKPRKTGPIEQLGEIDVGSESE